MSFPNIPNVTPSITLDRAEAVNLLLASIAFEELGLAHIINAEAEKIQAVLGTLPESAVRAQNISDLLAINESVNKTLKTVVKKEMLLQFKLENILDIPVPCQVAVIARLVLEQQQGGSLQRFFGTAQGTDQVTVEILVNESPTDSAVVNVINNQFTADLSVPEGLPPGSVVTIRVTSAENPNCQFEQEVTTIPLIPTP